MGCASIKKSFQDITVEMRGVLGNKIMLINTLGFSRLDFMRPFDGTFSEGKAVNAAGLLTAGGKPAIMWTSNPSQVIAGGDFFFPAAFVHGNFSHGPFSRS